jgi:hypothetical protein
MSELEEQLGEALLDLWHKWKRVGYHNNWFNQMVVKTNNTRLYKGPLGTVRHLLRGKDTGPGFKTLVRAGKLEWTVEALLQDPKWRELPLTEMEWKKARHRYQTAKAATQK